MKLKPLKSDVSQQEEILWWRNYVVLFTLADLLVLMILLLMGSAVWIQMVMLVAAVFGVKQIIGLTNLARDCP